MDLGPLPQQEDVNIDVAVRQVPSGLGESSHAHVEDVDDDSKSEHEVSNNSDIWLESLDCRFWSLDYIHMLIFWL